MAKSKIIAISIPLAIITVLGFVYLYPSGPAGPENPLGNAREFLKEIVVPQEPENTSLEEQGTPVQGGRQEGGSGSFDTLSPEYQKIINTCPDFSDLTIGYDSFQRPILNFGQGNEEYSDDGHWKISGYTSSDEEVYFISCNRGKGLGLNPDYYYCNHFATITLKDLFGNLIYEGTRFTDIVFDLEGNYIDTICD